MIFNRNYVDKAKVKKIAEKSGAGAELLENFKEDGSQKFDVYQSRWQFAEHMAFYLPACVRQADTVSLGDSSAKTALKRKHDATDTLQIDPDGIELLEFAYDVCDFM